MIKPELYHKTVGILFDAYFNDTLRHNNCHACAVGNIIAGNNGIKFSEGKYCNITWKSARYPRWDLVFVTTSQGQRISPNEYTGIAKLQIDSTGYEWQDLAKIDRVFETARTRESVEGDMFNGLVAVLDVLAEIHQVTDQDLLTSNNNRFKEQYEKRIAV